MKASRQFIAIRIVCMVLISILEYFYIVVKCFVNNDINGTLICLGCGNDKKKNTI